MERGDIGAFTTLSQACVFEGLLAQPPTNLRGKVLERIKLGAKDWDAALKLWKPFELPVKTLIDNVDRLGISTKVITFLADDAVDPIYRWLLRKGVSTTVEFYPSVEVFVEDLKFDRSIRNVYVPTEDLYRRIGIRASVVNPDVSWRV
jgi:hypothetical protein